MTTEELQGTRVRNRRALPPSSVRLKPVPPEEKRKPPLQDGRDSYAVTALSDILDRSLHAAAARLSVGLSPAALAEAYFDWATHLAFAPGKRLQLVDKALRKTVACRHSTLFRLPAIRRKATSAYWAAGEFTRDGKLLPLSWADRRVRQPYATLIGPGAWIWAIKSLFHRQFTSEPVNDQVVKELVEAAIRAPNAVNHARHRARRAYGPLFAFVLAYADKRSTRSGKRRD